MSRFLLSDAPQHSDEWRSARLGRATGSNAAAIVAKGRTKGTESTMRRNYRFQLACERLTGKVAEVEFSNRHTERGNELEPFARMAYESETGRLVREAGFAYLPDMEAGCSVDGFVDDGDLEGIGEYKCPIPAIHFAYMQADGAPSEYVPQITHNLFITGAAFCDFASYCADFPEKLRLHVVRIWRDEKAISEYEKQLRQFLAEVDALYEQLLKKAA